MELLQAPLSSVIWCKLVIKLDPVWFKEVFFLVLQLNQTCLILLSVQCCLVHIVPSFSDMNTANNQ